MRNRIGIHTHAELSHVHRDRSPVALNSFILSGDMFKNSRILPTQFQSRTTHSVSNGSYFTSNAIDREIDPDLYDAKILIQFVWSLRELYRKKEEGVKNECSSKHAEYEELKTCGI
eukprot:622545_1